MRRRHGPRTRWVTSTSGTHASADEVPSATCNYAPCHAENLKQRLRWYADAWLRCRCLCTREAVNNFSLVLFPPWEKTNGAKCTHSPSILRRAFNLSLNAGRKGGEQIRNRWSIVATWGPRIQKHRGSFTCSLLIPPVGTSRNEFSDLRDLRDHQARLSRSQLPWRAEFPLAGTLRYRDRVPGTGIRQQPWAVRFIGKRPGVGTTRNDAVDVVNDDTDKSRRTRGSWMRFEWIRLRCLGTSTSADGCSRGARGVMQPATGLPGLIARDRFATLQLKRVLCFSNATLKALSRGMCSLGRGSSCLKQDRRERKVCEALVPFSTLCKLSRYSK